MNETEILFEAIYTFGASHQKRKAVEEMAELIKELMKDMDGKGVPEHIAEEIADTEITIAQLKMIYSNETLVNKYREQKLRYVNNLIFEARDGAIHG